MTQVERSDAAALNHVADEVTDSARHQRRVATLVRRMATQRSQGRPWRRIVDGGTPRRALEVLTEAARLLRDSAGRVRQVLIGGLAAEGSTTRQIGQLFDVSHQRISAILRRRTEQ